MLGQDFFEYTDMDVFTFLSDPDPSSVEGRWQCAASFARVLLWGLSTGLAQYMHGTLDPVPVVFFFGEKNKKGSKKRAVQPEDWKGHLTQTLLGRRPHSHFLATSTFRHQPENCQAPFFNKTLPTCAMFLWSTPSPTGLTLLWFLRRCCCCFCASRLSLGTILTNTRLVERCFGRRFLANLWLTRALLRQTRPLSCFARQVCS